MPTLQLVSKYAIGYGVFLLLIFISKLNEGQKLFDQKGIVRNPGTLAGLQIAGILWLGILPATIFDQSFLAVVTGKQFPGIGKLVIFTLLLINTIVVSTTQAERDLVKIREQEACNIFFARGFVCRYLMLRIVFLAAYEAWFRGYLLMDCIKSFGMVTAVFINVFLYTLLHCFSSPKEILGCIPFGALLCLTSIWFGAAWPAIALHTALAFTYELKLITRLSTYKNVLA